MKNIEKVKYHYARLFAKEYLGKDPDDLNESEAEACAAMGEHWAYIYSTIPEEHGHYDIFDFTGHPKRGDYHIPPHLVLQAKNMICNYCWDMEWTDINNKKAQLGKDKLSEFLRRKSVMRKRRIIGNNIVIYGSADHPIGRTMLASIVMKEAIRVRTVKGARYETYDWVDFGTLINAAEKDLFDLADYSSCDWLVVDNVVAKYSSAAQTSFITNLIDPFFIGRFRDRLPTILLCKFDIGNTTDTI